MASTRDVKTIGGTPLGEHTEINPATGQQVDYVVLSEAERAKGFVRPVRTKYTHVGSPGPKYPLRDLTDGERGCWGAAFVKFEVYPKSEHPKNGRFWTQAELDNVDKGCNTDTTMSLAIAETYARDASFYGATFCVRCRKHLLVGEKGEFVWAGTNERVGT